MIFNIIEIRKEKIKTLSKTLKIFSYLLLIAITLDIEFIPNNINNEELYIHKVFLFSLKKIKCF